MRKSVEYTKTILVKTSVEKCGKPRAECGLVWKTFVFAENVWKTRNTITTQFRYKIDKTSTSATVIRKIQNLRFLMIVMEKV